MIEGPCWVAASGLVCSVGLYAAAACAAMRAGIIRHIELPYHNNSGEPIVGAPVPGVPWSAQGADRLCILASYAVREAVRSLPPTFGAVPIFLAVTRRGAAAQLLPMLEAQTGIHFDMRRSRIIEGDNTAGHDALAQGWTQMMSDQLPGCLVGAVDSLLNGQTLQQLAGKHRLKNAANSDGVVPGEGASCVLLTRRMPTAEDVPISLRGLGFSNETATPLSAAPLRGSGLLAAVEAALQQAGVQGDDIDLYLSDIAGERFAFKEHLLMRARVVRQCHEKIPMWLCAESIGDIGAAAGLCQIVRAREAFRRGYAPGRLMLGCSSDLDTGRRAAVVLNGC